MPSIVDLIESVAADLLYLQTEWHPNITDHALRRGSVVLRRLLVQNELQRAWKAAGFSGQPEILTSTISRILEAVSVENLYFASAGGAHYQGVYVRGACIVDEGVLTESELAALDNADFPREALKVVDFNKAPCIVVEGVLVSRHMLIKYVSNKLGGAHFDLKRKKKKSGEIFSLLDQAVATRKLQVFDKNLVYFELLSIGQKLAEAEDIKRFCEQVGA